MAVFLCFPEMCKMFWMTFFRLQMFLFDGLPSGNEFKNNDVELLMLYFSGLWPIVHKVLEHCLADQAIFKKGRALLFFKLDKIELF